MKQEMIDNIVNILWPSGIPADSRSVFAILDGARDDEIEPMIRSSTLPHACLYNEPLTDDLRSAAPHIIELKLDNEFTQQLIKLSWGQHWGIFLVTYSPATLDSVRQSFRKINIVQDPSGRAVFFRYYDPRVLRTYLPTCTPDEVKIVFGPVNEIATEGETENQLQCFKHNEHGDKMELYNV